MALSDKTLYAHFARTVPSDMFQARAIADIVKHLNWTYVSLVSSEGLYGESGSKEFIKEASKRGICIATHEKIGPNMDVTAYNATVTTLKERKATGVVLFARAEDTRALLQAAKRASLDHHFAWVAADGWGTQNNLVTGVGEVAWGAITVELKAKAVPDFDQYMGTLTPWDNLRNPWFSEYWEEWFNCRLRADLIRQQRLASGTGLLAVDLSLGAAGVRRPSLACGVNQTQSQLVDGDAVDELECGSEQMEGEHSSLATPVDRAADRRPKREAARQSRSPVVVNEDVKIKGYCSLSSRISESSGYRQEQKVQFVVDAVYAMAHALHKAWFDLCDGKPGVVCEALKELDSEC